ncbi:MAG: hypothetical protein ISS71_04105 [Phycisphaerae bacterium]|nr:hypothetical protein [Phycisphaerae bacterium]
MKLMEGEDVLMEMRPEFKLLVIWFFTNCLGCVLVIGLLIFVFTSIGGVFEISSDAEGRLPALALPAALTAALLILIISFVYCIYTAPD